MDIKKHLREQAKQAKLPELSESELLFCKSLFESAQQQNGDTCAVAKNRRNLIIIISCAAALLTALIITLSVVLPKVLGKSLPTYFDDKIISSETDLETFNKDVVYCSFLLENVDSPEVICYSDSVSGDKLFYNLTFKDISKGVLQFDTTVVINQYYEFKYNGEITSQFVVPNSYTICYKDSVIKDFEITFSGFIKIKTESVYFSCKQFMLPGSTAEDAEEIFLNYIQSIIKLK